MHFPEAHFSIENLNSQNQEVGHIEYKEQLLWEYDEALYHQQQKLPLYTTNTCVAVDCALMDPFC